MDLDISRKKTLVFDVEIQGVDYKSLEGNLNLIIKDGFQVAFPAIIYEGKIEVKVFPLLNLLKENIEQGETVPGFLEVHSNNLYTKPWVGHFKVKSSSSILVRDLKEKASVELKKSDKTTIIKESKITKPKPKKFTQQLIEEYQQNFSKCLENCVDDAGNCSYICMEISATKVVRKLTNLINRANVNLEGDTKNKVLKTLVPLREAWKTKRKQFRDKANSHHYSFLESFISKAKGD